MKEMLQIADVSFVKSATKPAEWPLVEVPEMALCGRSNVGKSSLLNVLLSRKQMARVSKQPGRTRLLNFFAIQVRNFSHSAETKEISLVDLPGFGFAQISKQERATWRPMVETYFTQRVALELVLLLLDSRRVADQMKQKNVLQEEADLFHFLMGLGKKVIPVVTKIDQLPKHQQKLVVGFVKQWLGKTAMPFSAHTQEGVAALQQRCVKELFAE